MTSLIRTGLLALVIIVVGAYSIASQAAEPLVGSWRLVSWVEVETESKSVHAPFGDNPSGMITYTTDGHMSLFIIDPKRKPPAGPKATDAEADGLYRTMIAYAALTTLKVTRSLTKSNSRGIRLGPEQINSGFSR